MTWYEIYVKEIELKKGAVFYINDKIKHKKIFIKMLKKYADIGKKRILEAGCGTGIISTYMASLSYEVTAVDIDKQILKLAEKISNKYFDSNIINIKFVEKSIFDLNYEKEQFDVCFSNGVLEHFEDDKILNTLKQQLYISKYVVLGIPTQFFDPTEALYGDERFLPLSYWRKIIKKAGGEIIEEHSFHYMNFIEKLKNMKKIGRPKPFRVFVLKSKM